MTMQAMVDYLESKGFKATKEYDSVSRAYRFEIERNGLFHVKYFTYLRGPQSWRHQEMFLDDMIYEFKEREKKEMEKIDVLSIGNMLDEVRKLGFEADHSCNPDEDTVIIKARLGNTFIVSKTFRSISSRNFNSALVPSYAVERRFVLEDLINRCLEIKSEKDRKLYISTAGCGPNTIFEDLIKKKEKEMNNNIEWKVRNINLVSDTCTFDRDHFDVELEGVIKGPVSGNILGVSSALEKKLNEPEKKDEEYVRYSAADVMDTMVLNYKLNPFIKLPEIKKVIFNNPATIVMWADNTKTVVKAQNDEIFDPEKGLAMAITKKALGNEGNYFEVIKKWTGECEPPLKEISHEEYLLENLRSDCQAAYNKLHEAFCKKKSTKSDLIVAMEEAIGYLGEGLDASVSDS